VAPAAEPIVVPSCPETTAALASVYPDRLKADDDRLQSGQIIVIRKGVRRVMLYREGTRIEAACWSAGLGFSPTGHKQVEGDGKTPEGFYVTSDKPWSQFYGAIAVHYPSEADAEAAVTDGRISAGTQKRVVASLARDEKPNQTTAMGGEILLHGGGGQSDWTLGCVAMDNHDLDRLRAALPRDMKTSVLILP
jgi:murein L,D-transpeptidase YafK